VTRILLRRPPADVSTEELGRALVYVQRMRKEAKLLTWFQIQFVLNF
jgi:hypothetical protein